MTLEEYKALRPGDCVTNGCHTCTVVSHYGDRVTIMRAGFYGNILVLHHALWQVVSKAKR